MSEVLFVQNGWIQDGRIQDGCHHQVEWECMSEVFFCTKWLNQDGRFQDSWIRIKTLSQIELDWVRVLCNMAESKMAEFKICHHLVSQIESLCQSEWRKSFWVLRERTKMSESKMADSNMADSRWLPSSSWVRMNEFESDWTSLSQSFVQNGWIQDGRIKDGKIQDGCHH